MLCSCSINAIRCQFYNYADALCASHSTRQLKTVLAAQMLNRACARLACCRPSCLMFGSLTTIWLYKAMVCADSRFAGSKKCPALLLRSRRSSVASFPRLQVRPARARSVVEVAEIVRHNTSTINAGRLHTEDVLTTGRLQPHADICSTVRLS